MSPKPPSVAGANPGRTRHHNRQMVLGHVRDAGKIGRAEIARISGLSTQAVSNIIADLADDGLLQERGRVSSGRGLPAVQYALNPSGGYALGFEIRPDVVFTALLDLDGKTVFSDRVGEGRAGAHAGAALFRRSGPGAFAQWPRPSQTEFVSPERDGAP